MGEFGPGHLVVLAVAFIVLFGANKLPQLARSVGQSMRILKAETRGLSGEEGSEPPSPTTGPPQAHPDERPPAG